MPDAQTLAGFVRFLARQFLLTVPMLLAVRFADNATAHAPVRERILPLSVAVVLGAAIHGTAFLYTQPRNVGDSHKRFVSYFTTVSRPKRARDVTPQYR